MLAAAGWQMEVSSLLIPKKNGSDELVKRREQRTKQQ